MPLPQLAEPRDPGARASPSRRSAELKPDQKDTDSLPPYEELDPILRGYVEQDLEPRGAGRRRAHRPEVVARVIQLVDRSEYKRRQCAARRQDHARAPSAATGACRSSTATARTERAPRPSDGAAPIRASGSAARRSASGCDVRHRLRRGVDWLSRAHMARVRLNRGMVPGADWADVHRAEHGHRWMAIIAAVSFVAGPANRGPPRPPCSLSVSCSRRLYRHRGSHLRRADAAAGRSCRLGSGSDSLGVGACSASAIRRARTWTTPGPRCGRPSSWLRLRLLLDPVAPARPAVDAGSHQVRKPFELRSARRRRLHQLGDLRRGSRSARRRPAPGQLSDLRDRAPGLPHRHVGPNPGPVGDGAASGACRRRRITGLVAGAVRFAVFQSVPVLGLIYFVAWALNARIGAGGGVPERLAWDAPRAPRWSGCRGRPSRLNRSCGIISFDTSYR